MLQQMFKIFFGYTKRSSVTGMLLNLGLPSFNAVLYNYKMNFTLCKHACDTRIMYVVDKWVLSH